MNAVIKLKNLHLLILAFGFNIPNFLIKNNFRAAVDLEYSWGAECVGEGVLGLTKESLREYLQFVGDMRLRAIGLPKYWNSSNPFPWIDEITQTSMIEVNFFEGAVKEYSVGALDWD